MEQASFFDGEYSGNRQFRRDGFPLFGSNANLSAAVSASSSHEVGTFGSQIYLESLYVSGRGTGFGRCDIPALANAIGIAACQCRY